jgi:hypothetical protein
MQKILVDKQEKEQQKRLFKWIEDIIPKSTSLVDELADVLEISTDSAYRRLRGETLLNINEIAVLCTKYSISFDSFISELSNSVTFGFATIQPSTESFFEYLSKIYYNLKRINQAGNASIIYSAEDIPIFHLFGFPDLAKFKLYYWLKSVINVPEFGLMKYTASVISDNFIELGIKMRDEYYQVNSVEVWSELTIYSICKQIQYCLEAGFFASKKDLENVYTQLYELLDQIKVFAENNKKFTPAMNSFKENYQLYSCDFKLGNNCIFISQGDSKTVYLTFNTLNSLHTSNKSFCADTERWLGSLIKKTELISGVSEKLRNQFFMKNSAFIKQLIETVEKG